MVEDGRALAGVVVAAVAAAGIVWSMRPPGSPVRVGPRLRSATDVAEGAERAETLLAYDLRLDPGEEPPEGYKDRWTYAPLGLVVTAFRGTGGSHLGGSGLFVVANWPTQHHQDSRGRGAAARWPFIVASIRRDSATGAIRVEYGRKSKDAILKGGYKPLPEGFVEKEKGLLDGLMDVAHHVMRGVRTGPDVVWSRL